MIHLYAPYWLLDEHVGNVDKYCIKWLLTDYDEACTCTLCTCNYTYMRTHDFKDISREIIPLVYPQRGIKGKSLHQSWSHAGI